jgi:hypothetical protein
MLYVPAPRVSLEKTRPVSRRWLMRDAGLPDVQDLEALMDFSSQQVSEENWVLSSVYVTSGAHREPLPGSGAAANTTRQKTKQSG